MIYTKHIEKAIRFATDVHWAHQKGTKKFRKDTNIPYITHPLAVALILARVTDDEQIIAAGILHDTIENCLPYKSVTRQTIAEEFSSDIARIVDDVTEQDKTLPWAERKAEAMAHIPHMQHDSLLVKSADVLHNLTDLNDDIRTKGPDVFRKFNATQEETVTRYTNLEAELIRVWPENPLLPDIAAAMTEFRSLIA